MPQATTYIGGRNGWWTWVTNSAPGWTDQGGGTGYPGALNENPLAPTNTDWVRYTSGADSDAANGPEMIARGIGVDPGFTDIVSITVRGSGRMVGNTNDSASMYASVSAGQNLLTVTQLETGDLPTDGSYGVVSATGTPSAYFLSLTAAQLNSLDFTTRIGQNYKPNMGSDGAYIEWTAFEFEVVYNYTPIAPPTTVTPVKSTSTSSSDVAQVTVTNPPTTITPVKSTSTSSSDVAQVTATYLPTTITPVKSTSTSSSDVAQVTATYLPTTVTPVKSTSASSSDVAQISAHAASTTVNGVKATSASSTTVAQITVKTKNLFLGDNRLLLIKKGDLNIPKAYLGDVLVFDNAATQPFNPQTDIGWHSLFWAEGTAMQTMAYADTASVSTWPNETSESDAITGGAGWVPTFLTDGGATYNNKPVLSFTQDVRQALWTGPFTTPPGTTRTYVVIGHRGLQSGAYGTLMDGPTTNASDRAKIGMNQDQSFWSCAIGATVDTNTNIVPDFNPHLFVLRSSTALTDKMVIDGIVGYEGTLLANTGNGIIIGNYAIDSYSARGYIALVGVFDGDLEADPNYAAFCQWVTDHYGISVTI